MLDSITVSGLVANLERFCHQDLGIFTVADLTDIKNLIEVLNQMGLVEDKEYQYLINYYEAIKEKKQLMTK